MIGTLLSGRYRLESKLGSGGMSTVYLAVDETLERQVAIKVLHSEISDQPDQLERFRREARAVAQLSHPNIVAVIDAGEDGGHPYIVFEYVPGETLKRRIDRLGQLPVDEATAYAIEIGRGLAIAHERKLVHRDVKPQNVLIDADGRAKVTDFGIARSIDAQGLTATGRVLGTTDYVAPEQAMGQATDARSDIYSLGVVLYEMLIGDVPFHADTQVGVAMKHVNEGMPDVQRRRPGVSSALAAALERATAKDPGQRYPDIGALLTELEGALEVEVARAGHSTGEATTVLDSVPSGRRRLLTRRVSWAGALVLAAAIAVALAVAALTSEDEAPKPAAQASSGDQIRLEAASDFDPLSDDQTENPDVVGLATDSNPTGTAWVSEHYDSEAFGNLKEGVGIYVETDGPAAPTVMEVRSSQSGWDAEVYAARSGPPEDLEGWGQAIGGITNAGTDAEIDLAASAENRFFLLWFTKLPASTEEPDRFRAEVTNIVLLD